MEYQKCFQCDSELPFSLSATPTKCPFCGATNETTQNTINPDLELSAVKPKKERSSESEDLWLEWPVGFSRDDRDDNSDFSD